jgi:hypothetical protein
MLHLQQFKHFVTESIFRDMTCMGTYHPSVYVLFVIGVNDDGSPRLARQRMPLPELQLRAPAVHQFVPTLQREVQQMNTYLTATVYRKWALSYFDAYGLPETFLTDNLFEPDGGKSPKYRELVELGLPYRIDPVIVAVYEYAINQQLGMQTLGATMQLFYLRNSRRLPDTVIYNFTEAGTEHGDKLSPDLFGRGLRPIPIHELSAFGSMDMPQLRDHEALSIFTGLDNPA